eukprot:TRINITY_DN1171_c0_g1_i2.p1 TRINITY_DN1171_c0_g1~~TRINITY_DN1171_c0_g1_i2.p1  ORF type:complete len:758 (-),score=116.03 TRINITY_DN1171_c0_g1_i2:8-2281(-)
MSCFIFCFCLRLVYGCDIVVDCLALFCCMFDRESFVEVFMNTYPLFLGPREIFERIVGKYESSDAGARSAVLSLFDYFLRSDYLCLDETLQDDISGFIRALPLSAMSNFRARTRSKMRISPSIEFTPIFWDGKSILSISTRTMAEQLTLREQDLYYTVNRTEVLASLNVVSDFLTPLKRYHQKTRLWVITEILRRGKKKKRETLFSYFLVVCQELYELKNYSTMEQIVCALKSSEIQSLKIPIQLLTDLRSIISFLYDNNSKNYTEEIKLLEPEEPYIPILSDILERIGRINDFMQTHDNGRINFLKMKTIYSVIHDFGWLTDIALYSLNKEPGIFFYLDSTEVWENEQVRKTIADELEKEDKRYKTLETRNLWEKNIENECLEALFHNSSIISFLPGETIVQQNSEMKKVYQVKSGKILVMSGSKIIQTIEKDTFIGIETYLNYGTKNMSIYKYLANSHVQLYKFKAEDFLKMSQKNQKECKSLNYWIANQVMNPLTMSGSTFSLKEVEFQKTLDEFGIGEIVIFEVLCQLKTKTCNVQGKIACSQNYFSFLSRDTKFNLIKPLTELVEVVLIHDKSVLLVFNTEEITIKSKHRNYVYEELKTLHKNVDDISYDIARTLSQSTRGNEMMITSDEWNQILGASDPVTYEEGDTIVEQGNTEKCMYYIISGKCQLDADITIVDVNPGQIFGKLSFVYGEPSMFQIKATEKTKIIVLEPYYLNFLFESNLSLGGRFYYFLAKDCMMHVNRRNLQLRNHM